MKKQILMGLGLSSLLVLSGCETTQSGSQPQLKETVNYSSVVYQTPEGMTQTVTKTTQEPRPLLEKPVENTASTPSQPVLDVNISETTSAGQVAQAPVTQMPQAAATEAQVQMVQPIVVQKQRPRQERIKITGVGYGAESTYEGFTVGQRRLMAIRASKLDAYRSLAEQLYGIKIDSNTSVSTLTAQSDSFRARVNAVVKGARIVSITPMSDNNYETVLEVFVDRSFFEDVFVYTGNQHDRVLEPIETCTLGFNCYEAANYR